MIPVPEQGAVRILVVDDTPANVQLLIRMLSARAYVMQSVSSGEEALQAVRECPPDLILLDIHMPQMNGYEVCERLKANPDWAAIPVIFISALQDTTDKVKAFALGGVDYVTKPFQLEEVYARVDTHVKLRLLQRQQAQQQQQLEQLVAERTAELAAACLRVQELSRLKGEFLIMISHEMRTPANGLLGLGELLIRLCPPSDKCSRYAALFEQSAVRLTGLLDDVSLISEVDCIARRAGVASTLAELVEQVGAALPQLQITLEGQGAAVHLEGSQELLVRALKTVVLMGLAFSTKAGAVHLRSHATEQALCLRLELNKLCLSAPQVQGFFDIGSSVRAVSSAETLGLSPVVAQHILRAFGGDLQLVKQRGESGYLELTLQRAAQVPA